MTEANWNAMRKAMNQVKPKTKTPSPVNGSKCKNPKCRAPANIFIENHQSGDIVCPACGIIQTQIYEHQSPRGNNEGKPFFARVIEEDDIKVRLLANAFFDEMKGNFANGSKEGSGIADVYGALKVFKANVVMKGKGGKKTSMKGMHLPTIVCLIIYCHLVQSHRAMPLSIIIVIMNKVLARSRQEASFVNMKTASSYRTNTDKGIKQFFKIRRGREPTCDEILLGLPPSSFIPLTASGHLGIRDKDAHNIMKELADFMVSEISNKPPAYIATGCMFYISQQLHSLNSSYPKFPAEYMGVTDKEMKTFSNKINTSKNENIIRLRSLLQPANAPPNNGKKTRKPRAGQRPRTTQRPKGAKE